MTDLGLEINLPERRAKTRNSWLGVMGACAVVWYLLGLLVFAFTIRMDAETARSIYSAAQVQYVWATPIWVNIANVIAMTAGLIGSVYILLRKRSAYKWYMLSLAGVLLMMLDAGLRNGFRLMSSSHFGVPVMVMIIGLFLFWAAYNAKNKGELRTT